MNDQLYIPDNIKVGFQKREDTYSGKLGFITFLDEKGAIKKEKSWEGWRDKKIKVNDFKNEPTEGFVLNRNVGGVVYRSSWDDRMEKIRVWDPRGFEIEITIPNMLFLLENNSSIPGKGLTGEYVYSWQGQQLVLLPVNTTEYKNCVEFTKLQALKFDKSQLIEGYTYLTKDQKEVVYMGRIPVFGDLRYDYGQAISTPIKRYIFYDLKSSYRGNQDSYNYSEIDPSKLASVIENTPNKDFAKFYTNMQKLPGCREQKLSIVESQAIIGFPGVRCTNGHYFYYSPREEGGHQYKYSTDKISNYIDSYNKEGKGAKIETASTVFQKLSETEYRAINIKAFAKEVTKSEYYGREMTPDAENLSNYFYWKYTDYIISSNKVLVIDGDKIIKKARKFSDSNIYTKKQIEDMELISLVAGDGKSKYKPIFI